jgi:hypothetical protein
MGDYDGSGLGADNSFFHVSWGDNRLGGPDVRSARIGTALAGGELISWTPTGNVGSASNIVFTFNQPMDQTSFSVAQDVVSFTRNGNSIINQITGFTWLSSTQLRVDFNSQTTSGQYVLTIGPQILTLGGVPLDDNLNGTAGEAADAVAASFNVIAAPVVTGVSIGDGINTVQRSRVSQLQVSFDQVISYVGTPTAAYTVVRTIGGVPQGAPVMIAVNTQTVSGHSVATITFLDNLDFGSLSDGHYRLTVDHTQIVGMAADSVTNFHRFYGDANGDEHVDIADFGVFSATFNLHTGQPGFLSFFDKNNDGVIDIFDFGQFSIRLFTILP